MSWLSPLLFTPPPPKLPKRTGNSTRARPIVIEGVRYGSMSSCRRATGYSTMKIYYLMGERWRNKNLVKK